MVASKILSNDTHGDNGPPNASSINGLGFRYPEQRSHDVHGVVRINSLREVFALLALH